MNGFGRRAASRSVVEFVHRSCGFQPVDQKAMAARHGLRAPDRHRLVLPSGIPWQLLPPELACGSGMTRCRRLCDWQLASVWDLIHFALLDWLARYEQIDWSRAIVDT